MAFGTGSNINGHHMGADFGPHTQSSGRETAKQALQYRRGLLNRTGEFCRVNRSQFFLFIWSFPTSAVGLQLLHAIKNTQHTGTHTGTHARTHESKQASQHQHQRQRQKINACISYLFASVSAHRHCYDPALPLLLPVRWMDFST